MLVVVGFVVLALGIFYLTGEAGFFEPQYTMIGYFPTANGLRKGAEVWLEGVQVGNVDSVDVLRQPDVDPNKRVSVSMAIHKKYQDLIRTDSKVRIETQGALGNNIVEISRGTPAGEIIPDGGAVQGEHAEDIKRIMSGTNDFVANLDYLSDKFKTITDRLNRGEGTVGKLKTDQEIRTQLNDTIEQANQLLSDVRSGNGSIGLNSQDPLAKKADAVMARLNNMSDYVESGKGTLGQIPSLAKRGEDLAAHFQEIARRSDQGSLEKLMTSKDLFGPTIQKINALADTVENGQAAQFMKNPTFRSTMTQISSEILKLIYDFSKNPATYLKIDFRLF
jgi:phospholipid/cholesterol/gamma-HCH transport system substrate-binding protein